MIKNVAETAKLLKNKVMFVKLRKIEEQQN